MATTTPNYNLRKPADGDFVNVGSDINASMDTIDVELFEHEDRLDDIELIKPIIVVKSATETLSASTTLQNDNELLANLEVATYIFQLLIMVDGPGGTPDFKWDIDYTGTETYFIYGHHGPAPSLSVRTDAGTNFSADLASADIVNGTAGGIITVLISGTIIPSSTGTLNFRWAQNVSDAGVLGVVRGSWLRIERVA